MDSMSNLGTYRLQMANCAVNWRVMMSSGRICIASRVFPSYLVLRECHAYRSTAMRTHSWIMSCPSSASTRCANASFCSALAFASSSFFTRSFDCVCVLSSAKFSNRSSCLSVCLPVCMSVCLSVCLSVCMSVCVCKPATCLFDDDVSRTQIKEGKLGGRWLFAAVNLPKDQDAEVVFV